MGRRLVRRRKEKPDPSVMNGLMGGYASDSSAEAEAPPAGDAADAAAAWEAVDGDGGRYWWNRATNETTWEDPAPAAAAPPAAPPAPEKPPGGGALAALPRLVKGLEAELATYEKVRDCKSGGVNGPLSLDAAQRARLAFATSSAGGAVMPVAGPAALLEKAGAEARAAAGTDDALLAAVALGASPLLSASVHFFFYLVCGAPLPRILARYVDWYSGALGDDRGRKKNEGLQRVFRDHLFQSTHTSREPDERCSLVQR